MLVLLSVAFALDVSDCTIVQSADDPAEVRPVGDLDLDGVVDIGVSGDSSFRIYLSRQAGAGVVLPYTNVGFVRADGGDLTGDGLDDLLLTLSPPYCARCSRTADVQVVAGPVLPGLLPAATAWWRVESGRVGIAGDHNADGQSDVGYVHQLGALGYNESEWRSDAGQDVLALRGEDLESTPNVARNWRFHGDNAGYWYFADYSTTPVGDFDGDGRADVVFGEPNGGRLRLARGREIVSGPPRQGRTELTRAAVQFVTGGFDVQGDGYGDVLAVTDTHAALISGGPAWRLGRTYDERVDAASWRMPGRGRHIAYAGDRFGDGRRWMLVVTTAGAWYVELPVGGQVGGQGNANAEPLTQTGGTLELNFDDLGWPADVDGDGDDELLIVARINGVRVACAL